MTGTHQIQTERGIITVADRPYLKDDAITEGYMYAFTIHEGVNLRTSQKMIPVDIYSKSEDMFHHNFICVAIEHKKLKGEYYGTCTVKTCKKFKRDIQEI